jgi:hypothetical protein
VPSYTLIAAQINQINAAKSGRRRRTSTRGGATQADDLRSVDRGYAVPLARSRQFARTTVTRGLPPTGWRTL